MGKVSPALAIHGDTAGFMYPAYPVASMAKIVAELAPASICKNILVIFPVIPFLVAHVEEPAFFFGCKTVVAALSDFVQNAVHLFLFGLLAGVIVPVGLSML